MYRIIVSMLVILVSLLSNAAPTTRQIEYQDIVVYGGGFAGCAAASSAASLAPDKAVLLIIPEPVQEPGGLGTVGGQNFADIRYWQNELVTLGSFQRWYLEAGQFYNTKDMAEIIRKDLEKHTNLQVMYSYDIRQVSMIEGKILNLTLSPIRRGDNGYIQWHDGSTLLSGTVFIDASDDGRLARLAGVSLSVGRQDWPLQYLSEEEKEAGWAYQQAATLMFKVKGIKTPSQPMQLGEWVFSRDNNGSWGLAGGKLTWAADPVMADFNEKYAREGFSIKPVNAAQNGAGSDDWWVNTLLVYNVDARAHHRDRGTARYPEETSPDHLTADQAWSSARSFIQNPDFINAIRQFKITDGNETYGFDEAELVLDYENKPVVGEVLYIRESVHSRLSAKLRFADSENINYAVTARETQKAGASLSGGSDNGNYPDRIGLGYYMMDINAYLPIDLKTSGGYEWPVTRWLRPDWWESGGEPGNPVYLPYQMLITKDVTNLLLPGYASGCSSLAWAELRVLPNLAVLGDAAGAAAARSVFYQEKPNSFGPEQIEWIREKIKDLGGRLEK